MDIISSPFCATGKHEYSPASVSGLEVVLRRNVSAGLKTSTSIQLFQKSQNQALEFRNYLFVTYHGEASNILLQPW